MRPHRCSSCFSRVSAVDARGACAGCRREEATLVHDLAERTAPRGRADDAARTALVSFVKHAKARHGRPSDLTPRELDDLLGRAS